LSAPIERSEGTSQEWHTPYGRFGSDTAPFFTQREPFSEKWGTQVLLPVTLWHNRPEVVFSYQILYPSSYIRSKLISLTPTTGDAMDQSVQRPDMGLISAILR
jgi:hypothetical protein